MNINPKDNLLLLGIAGSRGYGINTEESDTDIVGVFVPPREVVMGFAHQCEQVRNNKEIEEWMSIPKFSGHLNKDKKVESTIYAAQKFFYLCSQCNPNIIEIVWMPEENILYRSYLGKLLMENREIFLSTKAKFTFSGYAFSQLKRIETHRRWLLNPRQNKPERKNYGLPDTKSSKTTEAEALIRAQISRWQMDDLQLDAPERLRFNETVAELIAHSPYAVVNVADTDMMREAAISKIGFEDNLAELIVKEHKFHSDLQDWKNYQTWKTNRNPDRAALEAKSGYDTKHAAHLTRLMLMASEILQGKGVIVKRPDAEFIKNIRNGMWTYEELMIWVKEKEAEIEKLYTTSTLPKKCDIKKLNDLCVLIHERSYVEAK